MAKLPLPNPERLRQLLDYNPDTGKLYWKPRSLEDCATLRAFSTFQTRCAGKEAFTADKGTGYLQGTVERRTVVAHRMIWAMMTGSWPEGLIDHINHVRTDNRWCNLRLVSRHENAKNQSMRRSNTSGRIGVRWHKLTQGWIAMGRVDGKAKQLLHTRDFDEACAARAAFERAHDYHPNHGAV